MANYKVVGALVMLLALAIGAAALIVAIWGVIAAALLSNITFMKINRQWSPHETQKMERSALFAETQASLAERDKKIEDYCKHQLAVLKIELKKEIKVLQKDFKLQLDTLKEKQQEEMKMQREDFELQLDTLKVELREEIKVLREEIQRLNKIQTSNTPGIVRKGQYTNSVPLLPRFDRYTGGWEAGKFGGNS